MLKKPSEVLGLPELGGGRDALLGESLRASPGNDVWQVGVRRLVRNRAILASANESEVRDLVDLTTVEAHLCHH